MNSERFYVLILAGMLAGGVGLGAGWVITRAFEAIGTALGGGS